MKTYNLLRGDYFGQNDEATRKYNDVLVPQLKKLGITKEKVKESYLSIVE